jgi:hypothetical protein
MTGARLICCVILVLTGCERPTSPLLSMGSEPAIEELVLAGFGITDTVTVGTGGFRVGGYHNFSTYDSLRISFTANYAAAGAGTGGVLVRVGPANTFSVLLSLPQQEVSILVPTALLAKPQSSALTFYARDPEVSLVLTRLRVVGWAGRHDL